MVKYCSIPFSSISTTRWCNIGRTDRKFFSIWAPVQAKMYSLCILAFNLNLNLQLESNWYLNYRQQRLSCSLSWRIQIRSGKYFSYNSPFLKKLSPPQCRRRNIANSSAWDWARGGHHLHHRWFPHLFLGRGGCDLLLLRYLPCRLDWEHASQGGTRNKSGHGIHHCGTTFHCHHSQHSHNLPAHGQEHVRLQLGILSSVPLRETRRRKLKWGVTFFSESSSQLNMLP